MVAKPSAKSSGVRVDPVLLGVAAVRVVLLLVLGEVRGDGEAAVGEVAVQERAEQLRGRAEAGGRTRHAPRAGRRGP